MAEMKNNMPTEKTTRKRAALACTAALLCVVCAGCASEDTHKANYSISINVPYATVSPRPTEDLFTKAPLSIGKDGAVKLNDTSLLDSYFTEDDLESNGQYERLEAGKSGDNVTALQTRLKQLNYYTGEITGIYDRLTEEAVQRFELTYGNMQTGVATPSLQGRLFATGAPVYGSEAYDTAVDSHYATLQMNDSGGGVRSLQMRLKELGYPIEDITGVFDEDTAYAVSQFYQAYGFEPNDSATVAMQRELYSENAYRYNLIGSKADADIYEIADGSTGSLVINLQTRLIQLGYLTKPVSGHYDVYTADAVRAFQRGLGLEQTGVASAELQQVINSPVAPTQREIETEPPTANYKTLSRGDTGDEVRALQRRLVQLGYATGASNGSYEEVTLRVINLFRDTVGIRQTGVASAELQGLLFSDFAPAYGSEIQPKATIDPNSLADAETFNGELSQLYQTLEEGSKGQDVLALENRLYQLGYLTADADDFYNDNTTMAVRHFQRALGVKENGVASTDLQYHLFSMAAPENGVVIWPDGIELVALYPGDVSEAVLQLQNALIQLGYLENEAIQNAYGIFNDATLQAVQSAQRAMGYTGVTRSAGTEFQAFLYSGYSANISKYK